MQSIYYGNLFRRARRKEESSSVYFPLRATGHSSDTQNRHKPYTAQR